MLMCAIAGILGPRTDRAEQEKLLRTMRRRGPDGSGVYEFEDLTLLHTRLAVIDPEGGRQPMELSHGGEKYVMIYNGELYNTAQVRRELCTLGHTFRTHADTEVVLHAYAQWGEASLQKLNGIFAFAVWEERRRRLFLARDRIGVKPLFFIHSPKMLAFASEIKTLLAMPGVTARLDAQGAAQVMLLGPGRIPGSGVFRDIYEVEPGQYGIYQNGILTLRRYWHLTDRPHRESFAETAAHVRSLVLDAIRRQMVSDVPIGTFLSGGLDSSLISAICAQEAAKIDRVIPMFSLDYERNSEFFKPGKFQPNSDTEYIELMRKSLPCQHHWTVLTAQELVDALEDATIARDLPGMADVDSSLLAFCGQLRPHVKVALSGECADEIFGGYPWYRDPQVRDRDGFPWAQTTAQRAALMHPQLLAQIDAEEFVHSCYEDTVKKTDILPEASATERRMKQMVALNFKWFMQTLLDRKDRMSMYHGLEVRVPFCDHTIAEYLYCVPWEFKDHQGREKGLLRAAMEGILPKQVLYRKKSPYPKTHDPAYEALVSQKLREVIEAPDSPIFALVPRENLIKLADMELAWPWYGQLMRRPQTIAYMLQVNFWLKHYGISVLT